ncbi:hypothetical protein QBZ16_003771 [Prototheca wickerhamii]|uniref:Uncharacterized protein n=1 Tax=Prototheca wickerhamii TaxID=3111 RepID=A0AAD9IGM1_PROWI|nr:hypothetical protein QBZ16_003771 [Prototheca wickerhamii]
MAYDHPVRRADALRPFVLQTFGGMYLDLDVECFAPMDAMLAGADLVLQTGLDINVQTGPAVIMETLQRLIWPLGTFFTPCLWNDRRCHRQLALQRAVGSVPPGIVGYHRYSASWHSRGRNRFGILNEQDAVWSISAARWGF